MFGIGKKGHHKHDATGRAERPAPMRVGLAPGAGNLPAQVDLRPQLGPVEDVGNHFSTGAFVVAACIDRILARSGSTTGKISRAFLWYKARAMIGKGGEDASATLTEYITAELLYGHVPDADWPYTEDNILKEPPKEVGDNVRTTQGFEWGQTLGADAVKAALADGWPIAFRYSGPQDMFDEAGKTGKMAAWGGKAAPDLDNPPFSLTLLLVGYDDTAKTWIVRNCWGEGWGDKGGFTMPYDTLAACCLQNNFFYIGTQETPKRAIAGMSPGADSSSTSPSADDDQAKKLADARAANRKELQDDLEDAKKSARSRLRDAVEGGSKRMADRDATSQRARDAEAADVQKQIDADRAAADERRRATLAGPGKAAPANNPPPDNNPANNNGGGDGGNQ